MRAVGEGVRENAAPCEPFVSSAQRKVDNVLIWEKREWILQALPLSYSFPLHLSVCLRRSGSLSLKICPCLHFIGQAFKSPLENILEATLVAMAWGKKKSNLSMRDNSASVNGKKGGAWWTEVAFKKHDDLDSAHSQSDWRFHKQKQLFLLRWDVCFGAWQKRHSHNFLVTDWEPESWVRRKVTLRQAVWPERKRVWECSGTEEQRNRCWLWEAHHLFSEQAESMCSERKNGETV